jgi:ferredoxin-NADP reductase/Na+-translocating ferredoxin:NAD+ oxidoreductase RnfD subunit
MKFIDNFLNKITMYHLVLHVLAALALVAMVFGALGILPYSPLALLFSIAVLVLVSWITNKIFAHVFKAQTNIESTYITALILALIITPVLPRDFMGISFLIWAAIWATASKYILAANKKHFFNPAAFAVALTALTINQSATWWIGGNLPMLGFVVVGGLLIVRKIKRGDLMIAFFAAAIIAIILGTPGENPLTTLEKAILHAPLFFFAFVMLTEPLTTPPTRSRRIAYGIFVGVLFAPWVHIGSLYSTPELALLAGNVLSYFLSPKSKYVLKLKQVEEVGTGMYDFIFRKPALAFQPGQYLEWTLGQGNNRADNRGNRRYFTIASSPTEQNLRLGVKFYDKPSSFKKRMLAMTPGDTIMAGQLAGDFTLPRDPREKLVFIAGGIGITPFRSMVKYLSDRGEKRSIVLLYSNRTIDEIAYRDAWDEAAQTIGLKTVYAVTGAGEALRLHQGSGGQAPVNYHVGHIDGALIRREIPDYRDRIFYISGTHAMVSAIEATLRRMGIPRQQIKTDFFPGF